METTTARTGWPVTAFWSCRAWEGSVLKGLPPFSGSRIAVDVAPEQARLSRLPCTLAELTSALSERLQPWS